MSTESTISTPLSCPCDEWVHPAPLLIPAGMSTFRRQIATFPEFRKAMLAEIRNYYPLTHWEAREKDDLGIMLLEMWAYVCDNLTFYDEVISHESYLRTAQLRPSIRKLIGLVGYLPRPAVAATAQLAAIAQGRQAVSLPIGAPFRSGAFDEEPPQVFELARQTVIHPFTNQWDIARTYPTRVGEDKPDNLLIRPEAAIETDSLVFIRHRTKAKFHQAVKVQEVEAFSGDDGLAYTRIQLNQATTLGQNVPLSRLRLYTPTQQSYLWTTNEQDKSVNLNNPNPRFILASINPSFKKGDFVLVEWGSNLFWAKIHDIALVKRSTVEPSTMVINGNSYEIPGNEISVTRLTLRNTTDGGAFKAALNTAKATDVIIHHGMQYAGLVVREARKKQNKNHPLLFTEALQSPLDPVGSQTFLLQDVNMRGVALTGELAIEQASIIPSNLDQWQDPLYTPVKGYGNILEVSRGESVRDEILGNGDASLASQTFKLQKKPLTYLLAAAVDNDQGVINTLEIYVDGIRWTEVSSFYLSQPEDEVYIVRQDDEAESYITFGDGTRGRRLPSGVSNVVAHYRFGAGEAAPPADSITQIAKPVVGLQSVLQPVAAKAGADAEAAEDMRVYAPKSALILGRAVSIDDMIAVARAIPGVRNVQAAWRWQEVQQRPVIHLWYIGAADLKEDIYERMRSVTDPTTPFQIEPATPRKVSLSLDVWTDPRYLKDPIRTQLEEVLLHDKTGLLIPENLGVGQPFFRSKLYEAVLSVEGTTCVQHVFWNKTSLTTHAKQPKPGTYFDFEQTLPVITLTEDAS